MKWRISRWIIRLFSIRNASADNNANVAHLFILCVFIIAWQLRLENEEKKASYLAFRLRLVALWVICNIIPPAAILHYQQLVLFADALAVIVFVTLGVRLFGKQTHSRHEHTRLNQKDCRYELTASSRSNRSIITV